MLSALAAAVVVAGSAPSQPQIGTAVYVVQADPRLCPSPLCGSYWVALANVARTRCHDGAHGPRCYGAKLVDAQRHPLETTVADGSLARAVLQSSDYEGFGRLGVLALRRSTHPPAPRP